MDPHLLNVLALPLNWLIALTGGSGVPPLLKKVETTFSLKRRDAASPSQSGHNIPVDYTLKIDDLCIALLFSKQPRDDGHAVGGIIRAGHYVKDRHLMQLSMTCR